MSGWFEVRTFFRRDLWTADLSTLRAPARPIIRALRLLAVVVWEIREGVLTLRAMGLVYTTLLSLVPFLAVAFSVLKAFDVHYQVQPLLARALEPLGEKGGEITRRVVEFVSNLRVGILGAAGLAGLLFTVISLLEKIEDSLNYIWRVRHSRSLARKFSDYLSAVLVGPVLVFTALALTGAAQSHWVVQRILEIEPFGLIVVVASRVMPLIFLCVAFTFLYKLIPYTRVHFGSALVGGATAAILWQLAGVGFAAFVAQSPRYAAIYSGFAVLVLFLIWLYVAWLVVLVGGLVAYLHQHPSAYLTPAFRRSDSHLFRERLALSALLVITRRHLAGEPPCRPAALFASLSAPPSVVEDLIDEFVRRGILLRAAEPEGIALARPPEAVTVIEVLDAVRAPNLLRAGPSGERPDPVEGILLCRDRAVQGALEGITLRTLALEAPVPHLTIDVVSDARTRIGD